MTSRGRHWRSILNRFVHIFDRSFFCHLISSVHRFYRLFSVLCSITLWYNRCIHIRMFFTEETKATPCGFLRTRIIIKYKYISQVISVSASVFLLQNHVFLDKNLKMYAWSVKCGFIKVNRSRGGISNRVGGLANT